MIVILRNVKKKNKGVEEGVGRDEGTAHRVGDVEVPPPVPLSPSGHSRGLGYVAGRQTCQGHLHSGTLPGASLGRRCFGGA